MPQPLSRVVPNASISIGNSGDRPISRHPKLGVLAIEALASWSNVEAFLLRLFVDLFGGHGALAADVFLSLQNQSAKSAAINAAATSVLSDRPDELNVLRAILALAKTNEKERNKIAHWVWGECSQLQDAILLVDPRSTIGELDLSNVLVYRANDFQNIIESNDELCGFGLLFKFILNGHVANRNGELLKKLLNDPRIRQRISQQRQGELD